MKIGLVGCVKSKQSRAAPAKDLYVSPLFRGRRKWVERSCSRWLILSALHGLVEPDAMLEPYDMTLVTASSDQRHQWARQVLDSLVLQFGDLPGLTFEIHAGAPIVTTAWCKASLTRC